MAIVLDGPVTPDEGTVFVRNIPAQTDTTALDAFMPDVYNQATEFDFTVLNKTGNTARFRAWDAPAHMNPRDQMVINRVPLVPLSDSRPVLSEQDLAKLYGLSYMNDPKAATANAIFDDLQPLAQNVRRRAAQMKGAVLSTGTAVINEGGLNGTVDFGVPGGNKLTAPTLWSTTATADIVTFLNTARAAYIALNGFAPGKWLSSTNVLSLMQQNANLQKMAVQSLSGGQLGGYAGLLPTDAVNAILGAYHMPSPTQYICDARVSVDGTSTLVFPSNIVVLGPPSDQEVARFQWGPTVTAQKLVGSEALSVDTIGDVPGLVGFVDRADEFPYKERSIVDALGFGGITNPNLLMILTVA